MVYLGVGRGSGRRVLPLRLRGHYVQVRFAGAGRWVTVAVSDSRPVAVHQAAHAYRDLRDEQQRSPTQVRVVSDADLRREGGDGAVSEAAADLTGQARAASVGVARV